MEKQKGNGLLFFIILVICIIVAGIGGFFLRDKIFTNNSNSTSKTNNDDPGKNNTTYVAKEIDSKDWVFDASYEFPIYVDSYSTSFGVYKASDIIVPYINIDSKAAVSANAEIKAIYKELIEYYNEGCYDKISYVDSCTYKYFINSNILSVVVSYGCGGTDVVYTQYYTCNFDLTTGEKIDYETAYKTAGLTDSTLSSKVENQIKTILDKELSNFGEDYSYYTNKSISDYQKSVNNKKVSFYLDNNCKLNIIPELSIPAGAGAFNYVLTIE